MQQSILIAHVVLGMLFVFCVLIQDKGTGLSAALGGTGGFYASQRGAAKAIHYITSLLCVAFFATALVYVILPADPVSPASSPAPVTTTPATVEPVSVESAPVETAQ
jgi:protein translocase SecG subunit